MKPDEILREAGKSSSYYPSLTKITGSIASAILMSQLLKWSVSGRDAEGWITKKTDEAALETGLGWIEMQEAKNQLLTKGFIEQKDINDTDFSYRINSDNMKEHLGDIVAVGKLQGKFKKIVKELTADGLLLSSDMLGDVARATPYAEVDNTALEGFISLYGLSSVISTLDILAAQYREKPVSINNPTMILAKAFIKGVVLPENHVSYFERLRALKAMEIQLKKEPEKAKRDTASGEEEEINSPWKGM